MFVCVFMFMFMFIYVYVCVSVIHTYIQLAYPWRIDVHGMVQCMALLLGCINAHLLGCIPFGTRVSKVRTFAQA